MRLTAAGNAADRRHSTKRLPRLTINHPSVSSSLSMAVVWVKNFPCSVLPTDSRSRPQLWLDNPWRLITPSSVTWVSIGSRKGISRSGEAFERSFVVFVFSFQLSAFLSWTVGEKVMNRSQVKSKFANKHKSWFQLLPLGCPSKFIEMCISWIWFDLFSLHTASCVRISRTLITRDLVGFTRCSVLHISHSAWDERHPVNRARKGRSQEAFDKNSGNIK